MDSELSFVCHEPSWCHPPRSLIEFTAVDFNKDMGKLGAQEASWVLQQCIATFPLAYEIAHENVPILKFFTGYFSFRLKGTWPDFGELYFYPDGFVPSAPFASGDYIAFRIAKAGCHVMDTWFRIRGFNLNTNHVPEPRDTYSNVRKRALGYIHRFAQLRQDLLEAGLSVPLVVQLKYHGEAITLWPDTIKDAEVMRLEFYCNTVVIRVRPDGSSVELNDNLKQSLENLFDRRFLECLQVTVDHSPEDRESCFPLGCPEATG